jgi:hypothetical protein
MYKVGSLPGVGRKGRLGPGHCALFPRTDVLVVPRASIYGKFSIACAFN